MSSIRILILSLSASVSLLLPAVGLPAQPVAPLAQQFRDSPFEYRPIATIGGGGPMPADLVEAVKNALLERGYGWFMFSPEGDPSRAGAPNPLPPRPAGLQYHYPPVASPWLPEALPGEAGIGSFLQDVLGAKAARAALLQLQHSKPEHLPPLHPHTLGYMTPAYFAAVAKALHVAKENGRFAVYYDEVGYPSGSADHSIPAKYYRKVLRRTVTRLDGGTLYRATLPKDGTVEAVVAVNTATGARVDLLPFAHDGLVSWRASSGKWSVQTFTAVISHADGLRQDYYGSADYMDPQAVQWFIAHSYGQIAQHLGGYLGNTIRMTFFDDVGIYPDEKTWNPRIDAEFRALTGRDPGTYYPALWGDIGPDTAAARVSFFSARAKLLGEGFPRLVTEWDNRHGVQSSGHTPGNYDVQPVDMNGDPFDFYRYSDIPMVDVIFGHGFGRNGYKLISSAADELDKPIVDAETFGSSGDAAGYRNLIELYVRGINRFVTARRPTGKPLGKPSEFAEWAGRCSLLLQGGRHIADIAIVYPIESLEAFYHFDAADNPLTLPAGTFISKDTDYQAVGAMLLDQLRRDFTFIEPSALGTSKFGIQSDTLVMRNKVDQERYHVLILPGGKVIDVAALRKIKGYFDHGGRVIATSLLPSKSAEFGQDALVRRMTEEIFGIDPAAPMPKGVSAVHRSSNGGQAVFIRHPSAETLGTVLHRLGVTADVAFAGNPTPTSGNGLFGYIHKQKDGRDIYFFGNSSLTPVDTRVQLRGRIRQPQVWDPWTGNIMAAQDVSYVVRSGQTFTLVPLHVAALSATFIVGRR